MIGFLKEHLCAVSRDGGCPVAEALVRCSLPKLQKHLSPTHVGFDL
jgi:hypothetical protein